MTSGPLHLDAYVRVSRVGGRSGESFISPGVQRESIEAWARAHGAELTWHDPELDASGGTMERPIFEGIMERVRAGQTEGVIVAKLDRFARTLVGALGTLEQFDRHGAVLVSVAENLDLSTPMGKAFLRILLVFAELERDRISESWRTAMANAVDRGIHVAKFTPFGYAKASDKRLVPGDQAEAVRTAFAMRAAHHTRTEVARRLDEIAPRANGGRWTPPMVDRMIRNRVYLGHAYNAERVNKQAHEPLVSESEWRAANMAPVRVAARGKRPNLLGGLARCGGCRYLLAPGVSGLGAASVPVPAYRCRRVHAAGECGDPANINGRKLEEYVEEVWRQHMAQEALAVGNDTETVQRASKELSEAEEELALFASDLTARRLLGERYHAALEERASAVSHAQAELQRAMGLEPALQGLESYGDLSVEDRKRILGSSIDAVIVKRAHSRVPIEERVTILWRGEAPDDLPRRGRDNGPVRPYAT